MSDKPLEVPPGRRPRGRPIKHGAYSRFALGPLTKNKRAEILDILKQEHRVLGPGDILLVDMLARMLAKVELIDRWLAAHGMFKDGSVGELQPVFHDWKGAVIASRQLLNDLGLTPAARSKLRLPYAQPQDLAEQIQEAREA